MEPADFDQEFARLEAKQRRENRILWAAFILTLILSAYCLHQFWNLP